MDSISGSPRPLSEDDDGGNPIHPLVVVRVAYFNRLGRAGRPTTFYVTLRERTYTTRNGPFTNARLRFLVTESDSESER